MKVTDSKLDPVFVGPAAGKVELSHWRSKAWKIALCILKPF